MSEAAAPTTFRLLLPPGWSQHPVTDAGRAALARNLRQRFQALNRPDLEAQLLAMLNKQWASLGAMGAVASYLPNEASESATPMSIAAVPFTARAAQSLEAEVRERAGATLGVVELPHGKVYRWTESKPGIQADSGLTATTISHLYPVPGERPKRGMLLVTSILHLDTEEGAEMLRALTMLSDAIAETFRWK